MKRSSWEGQRTRGRRYNVESGFLLCNIVAAHLGVHPAFENLPADERDDLGMAGVEGGGEVEDSPY